MNLPKHLAIIMDGNGRWAKARGRERFYGHIKGAAVAKKIITSCVKMGLPNLTLYTFSTENWFRPEDEVSFLMRILEKYLLKERATLMKQNVRFDCIGDLTKLPPRVRKIVYDTIEVTSKNTGMNLFFALNYGGRQDIVRAAKNLAQDVSAGKLSIESIDEYELASRLDTKGTPDPDLIIRTSGEFRISNFMLWQMAYSEFIFEDISWPDFTSEKLQKCIEQFQKRERRFGKTSKQLDSALI